MTNPLARRLAVLGALAAALALAPVARGPCATAEDEWKVPDHQASDMALVQEIMPEGWTLVSEETTPRPDAEKAIEDVVNALLTEQKLARDEITLILRSLKTPDGVSATVALVDLWQRPVKFPAGLAAKAKEKGWAYREMASPARLLVVAAPEAVREKVMGLQLRVAAIRVAEAAWQRMENRNAEKATALARAALALEPGVAFAHMTLARVATPRQMQGDPAPPPAAWEAAVAEYKLALDEKAGIPLPPLPRYLATGFLGDALVFQGGEHNAEGRDRLKAAVALSAGVEGETARTLAWEFRYNLACAHGRLKEIDDAFAQLKPVLEQDAKEKIEGIDWRKDPDFDNLHADPRWAELLKQYPEGGKPPEKPPEKPPDKPPDKPPEK